MRVRDKRYRCPSHGSCTCRHFRARNVDSGGSLWPSQYTNTLRGRTSLAGSSARWLPSKLLSRPLMRPVTHTRLVRGGGGVRRHREPSEPTRPVTRSNTKSVRRLPKAFWCCIQHEKSKRPHLHSNLQRVCCPSLVLFHVRTNAKRINAQIAYSCHS
jgi:hypothetical protein